MKKHKYVSAYKEETTIQVYVKRILIVLGCILLLCFILATLAYLNLYHPSIEVEDELKTTKKVTVTEEDDWILFSGTEKKTDSAVIFYPGAFVEYTSYAPLAKLIAKNGVDCVLVDMPCSFALLGKNRAEKVMEEYSYKNWYIAGHSLGGAMAASYASDHREEIDGLILLAGYSTESLYDVDFQVLSIYGSEDCILDEEKYQKYKPNLPAGMQEICINGANHSGFGSYGEQNGDGLSGIGADKQQEQTAKEICKMIKNSK